MRNSRFPRSVQLVARKIQPWYVIHDSHVACNLLHERFNLGASFTISCNKLHATIYDQPTHGTKQSVVIFPCVFSDNVLLTVKSVIHFVQQVARYDPRSTHARNEIKYGDFFVHFFRQGIIHRHERYSFHATSCTLRCTNRLPKAHTIDKKVRWKTRYFFTALYLDSTTSWAYKITSNLS